MTVPVEMMDWAIWFEVATRTRERMVAQEDVGTYYVSTVFLGLDHSFGGEVPLLFESMIFPDGNYCDRCGTWDEAIDMHETAVAHVQKLLRQLPIIIEGRRE